MSETGYNINNLEMESGESTDEKAVVELNGGLEIDTHLPKLKDIEHPLVPETSGDYIMREINGEFDLKLLSFVLADDDFFTMIEGEAGTGKNVSLETLCEASNYPRIRVNFSISSSYEKLVGGFTPIETNDSEEDTYERSDVVDKVASRLMSEGIEGERAYSIAESSLTDSSSFKWVDGLLTKAVKYGWLFIADEINAAEPEALMPFNGLTEKKDNRYLTIEEISETIKPHPRFKLAATRNPVGYAGVTDMNSALESRAYIINYDYHEKEALVEILQNETEIVENTSETVAESLCSLISDIRKQEQHGQIVTKISSRDAIKIGKLTNIMNIKEASKTVLLGIADPTDETAIKELINTHKFKASQRKQI